MILSNNKRRRPEKIKQLFSFLNEITVKTFSSKTSNELYVKLSSGKYILDASTVNYAYNELDKFFKKTFKKLKIPQKHHKNVLILGFGVGNVASILENSKDPPEKITGIEIDRKLKPIAEKYFNLDKLKKCNVIYTDAYQFTENSKEKYDLIIVDLFIDDQVPTCFESKSFLMNLKNSLSPGGMLVYNRLMNTLKNKVASEKFLDFFKSVLSGNSFYFYIYRNVVGVYVNGE